jgi:peptide deformylase
MGHPLLYQVASPIQDYTSQEVQQIIIDMQATLSALGERIGLAAPQVGISKRIVIFRVPKRIPNPRYALIPDYDQEEIPWTVLINPEIEPLGDETVMGWETCISVPGLLGEVSRFQKIRYKAYQPDGSLLVREAKGFHARVVQHECDHLDGILFPMRVTNMKRFGFEDIILNQHSAL